MRMYQRWGERRGWKVVMGPYAGEVAGSEKCDPNHFRGKCFWLQQAERGMHRLVR